MGYNPAIDAFNAAMEAGARRRQQDLDLEAGQQRLDEARLGQGSRVSRLDSDSRIARTAAEVAEGTKGANIKIAYNTATQGDLRNQDMAVDLGEKRETSAPRVASQNAGFEANRAQAPISTQRATLEQSERAATSPSRVQSTISTNQNTAQDAELKFEKEIIKLYDEGRNAEAEELARRTGKQIPDAVKNDAALRNTIKRAYEDAERWYPDSPARQKKHVQTIMQETQRRGPANTTQTSPRFDDLPGLPAPQETKRDSKTSTPLIMNMDALKARGIAKDDTDAFWLLNQSKNDAQATIKELFKAEYKTRVDAAKGPGGYGTVSTEKLKEISDESMKAAMATTQQLRTLAQEYGGQIPNVSGAATLPAPTAPAPAPAAPPADTRSRYERIAPFFLGGKAAPGAPTAPTAPTAPAVSPSGVLDGRSLQGAPAKQQERVPTTTQQPTTPPAQPLSMDEVQRRASGASPEQVREQARAAIAAGKDRSAVLQRLQQLGIDTSGL